MMTKVFCLRKTAQTIYDAAAAAGPRAGSLAAQASANGDRSAARNGPQGKRPGDWRVRKCLPREWSQQRELALQTTAWSASSEQEALPGRRLHCRASLFCNARVRTDGRNESRAFDVFRRRGAQRERKASRLLARLACRNIEQPVELKMLLGVVLRLLRPCRGRCVLT